MPQGRPKLFEFHPITAQHIASLTDLSRLVENPDKFFCSCGCGQIVMRPELVRELEKFYGHCKEAVGFSGVFHCNSGYRCRFYNDKIGGHPGSHHIYGGAIDLALKNPKQYLDFLKNTIKIPRIGIYSWGIHFDILGSGQRVWYG